MIWIFAARQSQPVPFCSHMLIQTCIQIRYKILNTKSHKSIYIWHIYQSLHNFHFCRLVRHCSLHSIRTWAPRWEHLTYTQRRLKSVCAVTQTVWSEYSKCPIILNTLLHTFLAYFCFSCSFFFFLKILSGMANSVDPDQTAPIWVYTVCKFHYVRHFGVQNFKIFTVIIVCMKLHHWLSKCTVKILIRQWDCTNADWSESSLSHMTKGTFSGVMAYLTKDVTADDLQPHT